MLQQGDSHSSQTLRERKRPRNATRAWETRPARMKPAGEERAATGDTYYYTIMVSPSCPPGRRGGSSASSLASPRWTPGVHAAYGDGSKMCFLGKPRVGHKDAFDTIQLFNAQTEEVGVVDGSFSCNHRRRDDNARPSSPTVDPVYLSPLHTWRASRPKRSKKDEQQVVEKRQRLGEDIFPRLCWTLSTSRPSTQTASPSDSPE